MNKLHQLFPQLEEALRQELQDKGSLMPVASGTTLLQTGQNIRNTMLVLEGVIKLYRQDDEGNEFFVYYLEPGDGCALSMVCDRSHQTSVITAKAVSDALLLVVPLEYTEIWMREYRTWYNFVINTYRKRFEELLETVDSIAFKNLDERLEFYLRRHCKTLGTNTLNLTHTEIAQELNSSREVISRLMKKLSEKGKIRLLKHGIEVLDV
ncbi:MAG: Crp/Fnr family transcriptional regulator [Lewinellaceae bacterium]|nr:Crp/Fnr family transcriptional regulator [Saprospiraceae bacterium]MCB9331232.1 Crp/Fnr family transcriptional regulator [Lewinellaceae bacterium]